MKNVSPAFTKGNFRYRQIERRGELAIYEQTHIHGLMKRYAVVRIRVHPARFLPSGVLVMEGEAYPASSAWGKDGFTAFSLQEARPILVPWLAWLTAGVEDTPEEVPPL